MARNEEGEFELVLGNRQLLSVFFLMVVLLGVLFTTGYILGRNSPALRSELPRSAGDTKPIVVEHPSARTPYPVAHDEPPSLPGGVGVKTPGPVREAPAAREKAPVEVVSANPGEPITGQRYLQVVATARPDADMIAETLAKKHFKTLVAPGPSEKLFRVLVGPLDDDSDLAQTRTGLEAAGFKNPMVRKY